MKKSSIDKPPLAQEICTHALNAGFCEAKILSPFVADHYLTAETDKTNCNSAPSILVCTLPYGNSRNPNQEGAQNGTRLHDTAKNAFGISGKTGFTGRIAAFARKNYYAEAVSRLKTLSKELRSNFGGEKADFRIYCNSRINEKLLARDSGVGRTGRNGLLITETAGSLVIIAAMTLPFSCPDSALPKQGISMKEDDFTVCACCKEPACVKACPGSALNGDASMDRTRCIQWYASGNEEHIPEDIKKIWGKRLYGCTICQDVCPHNKRKLASVNCTKGVLPEEMDLETLITMSDEEMKTLFKGTAMGMSWLGPAAIRRNAIIALEYQKNAKKR